MAYQPNSYTAQGYTPGMSEEELKRRKAEAAARQAALPPVNSTESASKFAGMVLGNMPGVAATPFRAIARSMGEVKRGIVGSSEPAAVMPSQVGRPALPKSNPLPEFKVTGINADQGPVAGYKESMAKLSGGGDVGAASVVMPNGSMKTHPAAQLAGIASTPNAGMWQKPAQKPLFAGTGTNAVSPVMAQQYADFNKATNANYTAMRDRLAQGKAGYTPPQRIQSEQAQQAASERMQRESGVQRAASDQREQVAKLELGKQAGEYRLKEQEAASKGIVDAADVRSAAIMAGVDAKAAGKLEPKDAAAVYSKLIETIDPNDKSPEMQAKQALAEKMRGFLETAAGGEAKTAFKVGDIKEKDGVKYQRDDKGVWKPIANG